MCIATAIELKSKHAPLSSCFGKAKYYAFFDGEELYIDENPHSVGEKVYLWLLQKGVTHFFLKEQSKIPCILKNQNQIMLLYLTQQRNVSLDDMVKQYFKYL